MAKIHGVAGEWARVKGTVLGLWPAFLGVFLCGIAVAILVIASIQIGALLLALALIGLVLAFMRGLRHVESFFKGARGEERVSRILNNLPDQYHVFNDFIAGGSHIDHVVVGPAGVFSIETKNWRGVVTVEEGHILVDGRLPSRPPLAQAQREAALLKTSLAKAGWVGLVTPVLAFASDTFKAHVAEEGGTVIMNASELAKSFETARMVIPSAELERLVSLMENVG